MFQNTLMDCVLGKRHRKTLCSNVNPIFEPKENLWYVRKGCFISWLDEGLFNINFQQQNLFFSIHIHRLPQNINSFVCYSLFYCIFSVDRWKVRFLLMTYLFEKYGVMALQSPFSIFKISLNIKRIL